MNKQVMVKKKAVPKVSQFNMQNFGWVVGVVLASVVLLGVFAMVSFANENTMRLQGDETLTAVCEGRGFTIERISRNEVNLICRPGANPNPPANPDPDPEPTQPPVPTPAPPVDPIPPVQGAYYVAPNGNNSNPGTLDQPFQTIQHAANLAQAGDTVYVRAGKYAEVININNSGTQDQPITFTNYPGETPIIDGDYQLPPVPSSGWAKCSDRETPSLCFHYESLVDIKGNHIVFNGFEITESLGRGIRVYNGGGRPQNIDITNNIVHDIRGGAILLYQADYILVEGNEVYNAGNFAPYDRSSTELGWPGAISGNNTNNAIYRKNNVHENWTEGIMPATQRGSSNIVVEDNLVWDNRALQIYVHRLENAVIQRNVVYCTGNPDFDRSANYPHGIVLANELQFDGGVVTKNVEIINNLVAGCRDGVSIWNAKPNYLLTDITIAHNTIVDIRSKRDDKVATGLNLLSNNNQNVQIVNNIVQVEGETRVAYVNGGYGLYIDNNLWSSAPPSNAQGSNDMIGDAQFTEPNFVVKAGQVDADAFELGDNSMAVSGGTTQANVSTDFFGNNRDAAPDMGLHEK